MGRITQPDSLISLVDELRLRVESLERAPIPAMKLAAPLQFGPTSITSTVDTLVAGSQVSFTLVRPTPALFIADIQAYTAGGSGQFFYASLFVDGVYLGYPSTLAIWDKGVVGYTNTSLIGNALLSAGAHTVDLRARGDSGQTLNVNGGDVYALLLGG